MQKLDWEAIRQYAVDHPEVPYPLIAIRFRCSLSLVQRVCAGLRYRVKA